MNNMTNTNDDSRGEIVLYQGSDGSVALDVRLERESIWLSQKQMSLLFEKDTDTIGLHLGNIFKEGELEESATTEESSVVQKEGNRQVHRKVRLCRPLEAMTYIQALRRKQPTSFISLSRITPLWTETSALRPPCSSGFWIVTVF